MGKRIKDLDTRSAKLATGNAWFMVDDGQNNADKIGYDNIARQLLDEYEGLELAGKLQSVREAIQELLEATERPAKYS